MRSLSSKTFSRNALLHGGLLAILVIIGFFAIPSDVWVYAQDAGGGQGNQAAGDQQNLLSWLVESLGIIYILVFLSLSFILVALFIMNVLSATFSGI